MNTNQTIQNLRRTACFSIVAVALATSSCRYMKMNPAPDADKTALANNNSCYLATAANMLAGAGYGNGATAQERSNDIYNDLIAQFGTINTGWVDAALTWWLGSANNTWPANPYTVITVLGNKSPKYPWANPDGTKDIANNLRKCNMVGLSISWPTSGASIGSGGHAITAWGDGNWWPWNDYNSELADNPANVRIADSDRDDGGNIQQYAYDAYTSPNPAGPNEGNGWYINYSENHPYIKHIVTLEPTQTAGGAYNIQRVTGSFKLRQNNARSATDLHYVVGTDTEILSYITRISWSDELTPAVTEMGTPRKELDVTWNFHEKPVPKDTEVTITTEFVLRYWNAIYYRDVYFTYPDTFGLQLPGIRWEVRTPEIVNATSIPNVTGGYVVGEFELIDSRPGAERSNPIAYRFVHQYSFNQSPEIHTLLLSGHEGFKVSKIKAGHSYGMLSDTELWRFNDWMTILPDSAIGLGENPAEISIDWTGRLPYPEGENIEKAIPDLKGALLKTE